MRPATVTSRLSLLSPHRYLPVFVPDRHGSADNAVAAAVLPAASVEIVPAPEWATSHSSQTLDRHHFWYCFALFGYFVPLFCSLRFSNTADAKNSLRDNVTYLMPNTCSAKWHIWKLVNIWLEMGLWHPQWTKREVGKYLYTEWWYLIMALPQLNV